MGEGEAENTSGDNTFFSLVCQVSLKEAKNELEYVTFCYVLFSVRYVSIYILLFIFCLTHRY